MTIGAFLTPDELHRLTGYVQPSAQIRWLRSNCWRHFVSGANRPVVLRTYWNQRLRLERPSADELADANYEAAYEDGKRFDEPWEWTGQNPGAWMAEHWRLFILPVSRILASATPIEDAARYDNGPNMASHVYFLIADHEIGYVGKTRNAHWRLTDHSTRFVDLSHAAIIRVPLFYLDAIEAFYIHLLRPPNNVKYPPLQSDVLFDKLEDARRGALFK